MRVTSLACASGSKSNPILGECANLPIIGPIALTRIMPGWRRPGIIRVSAIGPIIGRFAHSPRIGLLFDPEAQARDVTLIPRLRFGLKENQESAQSLTRYTRISGPSLPVCRGTPRN